MGRIACNQCKRPNRSRCRLGADSFMYYTEVKIGLIHLPRRRCGLLPNYRGHLIVNADNTHTEANVYGAIMMAFRQCFAWQQGHPTQKSVPHFPGVLTRNKWRKQKYVCLRGLPYIRSCRSYVQTPRELDRHASYKSLEASHYNVGALADSSDLGLLGKQSSPKWKIPCLGRRWTTVQNLTPLDLSSVEKSVTVQTNTHTSHTLPIGMCG